MVNLTSWILWWIYRTNITGGHHLLIMGSNRLSRFALSSGRWWLISPRFWTDGCCSPCYYTAITPSGSQCLLRRYSSPTGITPQILREKVLGSIGHPSIYKTIHPSIKPCKSWTVCPHISHIYVYDILSFRDSFHITGNGLLNHTRSLTHYHYRGSTLSASSLGLQKLDSRHSRKGASTARSSEGRVSWRWNDWVMTVSECLFRNVHNGCIYAISFHVVTTNQGK